MQCLRVCGITGRLRTPERTSLAGSPSEARPASARKAARRRLSVADVRLETVLLGAKTALGAVAVFDGEGRCQEVSPSWRRIVCAGTGTTRAAAAVAPVPRRAAASASESANTSAFDTTSDGLPLIGPVPGTKGVYAAYGYGGNGITFSFMAAQLIGDLIAGKSSPLLRDFALDRDGPPSE